MSEETAKLIDAEVRRLVEEGEKVARKVLTDNIDELHLLAGALLEYETLSGEEAKRAIKGEDIGREDDADKRGTPVSGHAGGIPQIKRKPRSEEHTSELQSLMRSSYAVFCLKKKKTK